MARKIKQNGKRLIVFLILGSLFFKAFIQLFFAAEKMFELIQKSHHVSEITQIITYVILAILLNATFYLSKKIAYNVFPNENLNTEKMQNFKLELKDWKYAVAAIALLIILIVLKSFLDLSFMHFLFYLLLTLSICSLIITAVKIYDIM